MNSVKPSTKPLFDGSSNRIQEVKMSFLLLKTLGRRSTQLSRIPTRELLLFSCPFSSLSSQSPYNSISNNSFSVFHSWYNSSTNTRIRGISSIFNGTAKTPSESIWGVRFLSSEVAVEPSTTDGLTVEGIIAKNWNILDDNENDWKSHASAIAQSVHLIKKRLKWKRLMDRLEVLSAQLNKADLWDDPDHAGKISREHGSLMNKVEDVMAIEQELVEHIDMIKLAREENDPELESVSLNLFIPIFTLSTCFSKFRMVRISNPIIPPKFSLFRHIIGFISVL
ncbi:hypothetical protein HAX54_042704 [Datura stramonium]|uniref:Uncharacterized protein n=1 Tax=Datura stramonium TaxID=4076 RepID=A0ABS8W1B5_DATST|nr:hypothetical protein [Datura stramonium]